MSMGKIYYMENFERLGEIYIYIAGVESVSENLGRWKASSGEREKVGRSKATGSENFALCFSCKIKIVKSSRVNIFAFCTF